MLLRLWVKMGLAYTRIHGALERAPGLNGGRLGRLRATVERDWQKLLPGRTNLPEQRAFSDAYYRRMFMAAQEGVRGLRERVDFAAALAPPPELLGVRARGAFRDLFTSAEEPGCAAENGALLQEIADHVLDFLRFERNALRTVAAVQREINVLLERPQPSAPLTGTDLGTALAVRRGTPNRGLYYLLDTVRETLDLEVVNRADATVVRGPAGAVELH